MLKEQDGDEPISLGLPEEQVLRGHKRERSTMDVSVRSSMKVGAKSDKCHDLQTLVS